MYIYSVDYWVSFPSSEYGGLFVVLAKDDAEAIELLSCYDDDENEAITDAVRKADKFSVETDRVAGIIDAFIT
jgi:hypothetical protein